MESITDDSVGCTQHQYGEDKGADRISNGPFRLDNSTRINTVCQALPVSLCCMPARPVSIPGLYIKQPLVSLTVEGRNKLVKLTTSYVTWQVTDKTHFVAFQGEDKETQKKNEGRMKAATCIHTSGGIRRYFILRLQLITNYCTWDNARLSRDFL